jgi:hypothetical protein
VTTIDCVVAPLDQVQPDADGAVSVTLPPIGQSCVPFGVPTAGLAG